jgi:transcription elongation factor
MAEGRTSKTNPLRAVGRNIVEYGGLWTTAGAANMTADYSDGIKSIAYNSAAGKFLVTFVGRPGKLISCYGQAHAVTGTGPLVVNCVVSTYTTSAEDATVQIEFWEQSDADDALTDPANATWPKLDIWFKFAASGTL